MSCRRAVSAIVPRPRPLRAIKASFNHHEVRGSGAGFGTLSSQSGICPINWAALLRIGGPSFYSSPRFSGGGGPALLVEGFFRCGPEPLHRTSCGPPPHESVGRIRGPVLYLVIK